MTKLDKIAKNSMKFSKGKKFNMLKLSLVCNAYKRFFYERKIKMQLEFEANGTTLTARISGELDHHVAKKLREEIDLKLATGIYNTFIFDFSSLTFMDSSGIAVIMGRVKYLEAVNGKVKILTENDMILKIIKMAGLLKYVEIIGGK